MAKINAKSLYLSLIFSDLDIPPSSERLLRYAEFLGLAIKFIIDPKVTFSVFWGSSKSLVAILNEATLQDCLETDCDQEA